VTAVKGRKTSDEKAQMVGQLRRKGLSIRKIAGKVKVSKSTVHRLTRGISWEEPPARPVHLEIKRPFQPRDAETAQLVRPIAAPEPQFPLATIEPVDEEKYELDRAEAYLRQNRNLSLLYQIIDFQNRLDSLQSDDPLEEYKRLRRKCLSKVAVMNGFWSKRQFC
jgi:transposase-like protein